MCKSCQALCQAHPAKMPCPSHMISRKLTRAHRMVLAANSKTPQSHTHTSTLTLVTALMRSFSSAGSTSRLACMHTCMHTKCFALGVHAHIRLGVHMCTETPCRAKEIELDMAPALNLSFNSPSSYPRPRARAGSRGQQLYAIMTHLGTTSTTSPVLPCMPL